MKKCITVVLLSLYLLAGCTHRHNSDPAQIRVGICLKQDDAPYRPALETVLTNSGYYVNFQGAENDQSRQNEQLRQFISEQYDMLVIDPVMADATDAILVQLQDAQLPAVLIGTLWEKTNLVHLPLFCRVDLDWQQPGQLLAQAIFDTPTGGDLNGDGQVACAILSGPDSYADAALHKSQFLDTLTGKADVQLLCSISGEQTLRQGNVLTEGLLSRYGDRIEVLFCDSEPLTLGALEALENAGSTQHYVVGIGSAALQEQVQSGILTAAVAADYEALAQKICEAAAQLLTGTAGQVYLADYILYQNNAREG